MEKIVAVVVTYNRLEKLKVCLECLMNQSMEIDEIIIVNNSSSDGTTEYLMNLNNDRKLVHLKLDTNTGGSGGFFRGILEALEHGADWIWGMDDDAFPALNALEVLYKKKEMLTEKRICM